MKGEILEVILMHGDAKRRDKKLLQSRKVGQEKRVRGPAAAQGMSDFAPAGAKLWLPKTELLLIEAATSRFKGGGGTSRLN